MNYLAPDDSLNAIPLGGNDDGGENANTGDLQGILTNTNDFGSDSAADTDFPIQDNQESPGLGIPDLNSEYIFHGIAEFNRMNKNILHLFSFSFSLFHFSTLDRLIATKVGSSDNNPFGMMKSLASEDNFIGVPDQSQVNYRNIW